ncbi:MAG: DUF4139 domain-containing protein [Terriglobales bacterium]
MRYGRTGIWGAIVMLAALGLAAQAPLPVVVSTAGQRTALEVTVYSGGLALVQEQRRVTLLAGPAELRWEGVPANLVADSVQMRALPPAGARIEQQQFEKALLNPGILLKVLQGQTVTLIETQDGGNSSREVKVPAKLVADNGGQIWEIHGRFVVRGPGYRLPSFEVDRLPPGLFAQPTLVWRLVSRRAGAAIFAVRYLTTGIDWHADYALTLAPGGARGTLSAWMTVLDNSTESYPHAQLRLVAGQLNQAEPPPPPPAPAMSFGNTEALMMAPRSGVSARRAYAYHLFTVRQPVSLAKSVETRVPWLAAQAMPVETRYVVSGGAEYLSPMATAGNREPEPVAVQLRFANTAAAGPGRALPAGPVRVYGPVGKGGAVFLGADTLPDTANGGTVHVRLGRAFDLTARRTLTQFRVVQKQDFQATYRVTVRNGGPRAVRVRDDEALRGDWAILRSSQPYTKPTASTARFELRAPAGGATTLTYTVEEKY